MTTTTKEPTYEVAWVDPDETREIKGATWARTRRAYLPKTEAIRKALELAGSGLRTRLGKIIVIGGIGMDELLSPEQFEELVGIPTGDRVPEGAYLGSFAKPGEKVSPDHERREARRLERIKKYGPPRPTHRFRYFQTDRGVRCFWSVEKVNGKYVSWVEKPFGPGARTGKTTRRKVGQIRFHSKRKDAKARAAKFWSAN